MMEEIGRCDHYEDEVPEKRYRFKHPLPDYTGDCPLVWLTCEECRLRAVARMMDDWIKFQGEEVCDVLECRDGHRFPSFNQFGIREEEDIN